MAFNFDTFDQTAAVDDSLSSLLFGTEGERVAPTQPKKDKKRKKTTDVASTENQVSSEEPAKKKKKKDKQTHNETKVKPDETHGKPQSDKKEKSKKKSKQQDQKQPEPQADDVELQEVLRQDQKSQREQPSAVSAGTEEKDDQEENEHTEEDGSDDSEMPIKRTIPKPPKSKEELAKEDQQAASAAAEKERRRELARLRKERREADDRLPRTLFVGNVNVQAKPQQLKRFFTENGFEVTDVESIRFRSFAVAQPKLPRKAAFIQGEFRSDKDTCNAYVVMLSEEKAKAALKLNGHLFQGKHLRIDLAGHKELDTTRTVFLGNVPFTATEEEVWQLFSEANIGEVEAVRLVRDPVNNMGKGFAYVTFKEERSVRKAIAMNGVSLKDRELRISRATDPQKWQEQRVKTLRRQGVNAQLDKQGKTVIAKGAVRRRQETVERTKSFQGEVAVPGHPVRIRAPKRAKIQTKSQSRAKSQSKSKSKSKSKSRSKSKDN